MKTLAGLMLLALFLIPSGIFGQEAADDTTIVDRNPTLYAASFTYRGAGARAFAMGDAFVGLSNDINAGTWNPAGLWQIEEPQVSMSYHRYDPNATYTNNQTPVATESNLNISSLGHFAFVAPVRLSGQPWTFTFNYLRGDQFTSESRSVSDVDSEINPNVFMEDQGNLLTYNLGLSTRVWRQLSLGFTLNIYDGNRQTDRAIQSVYDSLQYEIPPIPIRVFEIRRQLDSTTSSGVNFTLSAMYKFSKLSVGGVVYTPYKLTHETDRLNERLTTANGLPSEQDSDTTYVDNIRAKQEIPLSAIFGLGWTPTDRMTLTTDFIYQAYGSVGYETLDSFLIEPNGDREDFFTEVPINWNNTIGIGAGIEYMLETSLGTIPLRGGLRYDQLPRPKNFTISSEELIEVNPAAEPESRWEITDQKRVIQVASDRTNAIGFSIGTGIHWGRIHFDIGYRFTSGAETNISETIVEYVDSDNDGFADFTGPEDQEVPVTETVVRKQAFEDKSHEFRLTFTGFF